MKRKDKSIDDLNNGLRNAKREKWEMKSRSKEEFKQLRTKFEKLPRKEITLCKTKEEVFRKNRALVDNNKHFKEKITKHSEKTKTISDQN